MSCGGAQLFPHYDHREWETHQNVGWPIRGVVLRCYVWSRLQHSTYESPVLNFYLVLRGGEDLPGLSVCVLRRDCRKLGWLLSLSYLASSMGSCMLFSLGGGLLSCSQKSLLLWRRQCPHLWLNMKSLPKSPCCNIKPFVTLLFMLDSVKMRLNHYYGGW